MSESILFPNLLKSIPTATLFFNLLMLLVNGSGELYKMTADHLLYVDLSLKERDMNELKTSGIFALKEESTNTPGNQSPNGSMALVLKVDSQNVHQLILHRVENAIYYRQLKTNVWYDYRQLAFKS